MSTTTDTTALGQPGAVRVSGPSDEAKRALRAFALDRDPFTVPGLAAALGCSTTQAKDLVRWGLSRQLVVEVGYLRDGKRGRPPMVYRYMEVGELPRVSHPKRRSPGGDALPLPTPRTPVSAAPTGRRVRGLGKELAQLVRQAQNQGWRVERAGKHYKLHPPDGRTQTVSATPADHRAIANVRAQLRRAGLVLG